MQDITFLNFDAGRIFNDEIFIPGIGASDMAIDKMVEIKYRNMVLGTGQVIAISQYGARGLLIKYKTRHLPNQEELLKDWWDGIKMNNQINQEQL